VSAFMSDDPQTGSHEARPESVYRPNGELGDGIEERMGQLQGLRADEPI
jgi:hypothetical protein